MEQTKRPIRIKRKFSNKKNPHELRKRYFSDEEEVEEKDESKEPKAEVQEAENDSKATLAGMLDPAKCDEAVVAALAEACAIDAEQAKQLVGAVEEASEEGKEAQESFSGLAVIKAFVKETLELINNLIMNRIIKKHYKTIVKGKMWRTQVFPWEITPI